MCDTDIRQRATLSEWCITVATATVLAIVIVHRALSCGLFGDELLFVHAIELGLQNSLMAAGSSHPPLVRIIVSLIADPSQAPDWLLRLPSIVFAIGSVFVWQRVLGKLIEQRLLRCLLLPAMALNPFWLEQAFQCLPYPALVFFCSLHCLAWLRFVENPSLRQTVALVLTGSVLPWIHFFGINVLIAGQLIWLLLLWNRKFDPGRYVYANLCTAALTLPVIPLAVFYVVHDRPYPLIEIRDYAAYFIPFSSYCFSKVTLPGLDLSQPFFVLVYLGIGVYVWKHTYAEAIRWTSGTMPD